MTSSLDFLHKILKDETRRKTILMLSDKGSLTYTDLMDSLGIVSTGTLNYHLKVLGDLLQKDSEGRYLLSEKGQLAARLLTEFPQQTDSPINKERLKVIWIFTSIGFAITALVTWYVANVPIYRLLTALVAGQVMATFLYYIKIKPDKTGRIFWAAVGVAVIGSVFWFLVQALIKVTGFRLETIGLAGPVGYDIFALISLIVLWTLGGFVGDWIGKKRHYKVLIAGI